MVINSSTITQISTHCRPWCLADSHDFIALLFLKRKVDYETRSYSTINHRSFQSQPQQKRQFNPTFNHSSSFIKRNFHNYFLTNLSPTAPHRSDSPSPRSSSSAATAAAANGVHRNKPSDSFSTSSPYKSTGKLSSSTSALSSSVKGSRELIVVRIPLKSAKQHFGVSQSRGTRPSNEDTYQAGIIEIPAFAKGVSINQNLDIKSLDVVDSTSGGPQVFCFGVFDGHGGNECSEFLKNNLYEYIEKTADLFELKCTSQEIKVKSLSNTLFTASEHNLHQKILAYDNKKTEEVSRRLQESCNGNPQVYKQNSVVKDKQEIIINFDTRMEKIFQLEKKLIQQWKDTVGGYFRRFKPQYFSDSSRKSVSIETVLMYSFLKADFDFISAQAHKPESVGNTNSLSPVKKKDTNIQKIGNTERFLGGSTASIVLISTPTPTPFWHPSSPSTMVVAHVGDTRIILCDTATGLAKPCTKNHHPSSPDESNRLRRYATSFVTDSFGEERISGLANTRAFGDIHSKRIGVSAEPDICRIELMAAEYSMLVLVSDGVSGSLNDQEIVDIVKEAKTPEQGAREVVGFATEVSKNGDNATCLVVRLGGWEKRREGGLGSLGTMECREWRRRDASDMRRLERHR
ncbi:Protein phosphatase 2C 4 [Erysiphe necator]|nr:Protein phosphatase 2C 4 [Erysiphe necator]